MTIGVLSEPVTTWNSVTVPYPREGSLHELFDRQAVSRPRAQAAVHHERTLSYRELKCGSDALAARLYEAGVRHGDTVGVLGGRSLEALVAFLGVLKAGAAYVPLDHSTPSRRLQAMVDDAGVHTVVTLPGTVCRLRRVRTRLDLVAAQPASCSRPPLPSVSGTDCAYVMFTSGSTGRPKPVAIPHRGVIRLAASDLVTQRPRPGDRVLHAYGLSSDASTIEIWAPLLSGASLVLVDRQELLSPAVLEERLVCERVTIAYLTTGVFHYIARTRPKTLRTLRFASAGGEAMDPDLARAVLHACPDTSVVNFYGPTENSVVSTAHLVRDVPVGATAVPIGRPLEHSTCCVLRDDGRPALVGEEGELFVGGDGLALGYLGDPELTSARFVESPLVPGDHMYRTGDRAVWREDGELEYRARADRQIKLRGHRIELDEIEARLRADERVGEAAVELEGDLLVGYVTPARAGQTIPLDHVRKELAAWLPASAVPAHLMQLAVFPVTSAGKVDRHQLREMTGMAEPRPQSKERDQSTGTRRIVADIWQMVLGVRPDAQEDFFALGGDSLLAAEAVNRTLAAFGIDARHGSALVQSLLQDPTLGGFAAAVDAAAQDRATFPATPAVDFRAEARLGFILPQWQGASPNWQLPRNVLLTGASGFVGAFLLDRLLRTTRARIHCPVRSRDRAHAWRRVSSNLDRYGLARPAADRLVCFPADLAEPGFGLGDGHFDELADTLDLVFHSAAQVNFLYPYTALRRANVAATKELIRLAGVRGVPVHFLSTIAVVAGFGTAGVRHVDEHLPLDHADRLTMGYAESKWVAEQSLHNAANQGLPVAIYRPYEITGDRHTGACNTETAICSLFKTIAETGLAPDIPLPMDFVPVDYLADAICRIALGHRATNRTYHLTNPRPAHLQDMLDRMRAAGHSIRQLPYKEWVDELLRHVAQHPTSATAPFVSLCVDRSNKADMSVKEMFFEGTFPTLGRANVERFTGDLSCPPVDTRLLDRYLDYFYATGYLNRPRPVSSAAPVPTATQRH
ncbi:amino acid adenylation domain-containing protein [Streptomyces sp. NPDC093097]|uniref:amino acid adenylation domain-containing protein n=1 Tax=Streptomyces sp. NPDC093097 TaxID=3366027 RepID=UPI003818F03F